MSSWCGAVGEDESNNNFVANQKQRSVAAMELLEELQHNNGFAHVCVPFEAGVCNAALTMTRKFLQEVPEKVRRSCLSAKDRARRGYSPMCTENFASLLNVQGKNDLVRKFRMGPPVHQGSSKGAHIPSSCPPSLSSLWQPNEWPSSDLWKEAHEFQHVMEEYYQKASMVANGIVKAICHGLIHRYEDLKPFLEPLLQQHPTSQMDEHDDNQTSAMDVMRSSETRDSSILTLLGYRHGARHKQQQQQSRKKKQSSRDPLVAAHTDVGIITLVLFDQGYECAKLQRIGKGDGPQGETQQTDDENAPWIDVNLPPIVEGHDPVFVVNVADCLSELSQGRLVSALHRVVPVVAGGTPTNKSTRNGCALFVGLDPHQRLLFPCNKEEDAETETTTRTMTFEEWRKERIFRAQRTLQYPKIKAETGDNKLE